MSDNTSIQIDKETHRGLKILSAQTNKKLYELITEALVLLQEKYSV